MFSIDTVKQHPDLGYISIRNATYADVPQCIDLLQSEFDMSRELQYASRIIDGSTIIVQNHKGEILSLVTVDEESPEFIGCEIHYAVTKKEYRTFGLMSRLFEVVINHIPHDDIYVICWWTGAHEVHLQGVLDKHNFELVRRDIRYYNAGYYRSCKQCPYFNIPCRCGCDLYRLCRG